MRLLVVEDDDSVAAALVGLLRHHGFEVVRVATGADALARDLAAVDVVLLDLGLPDRDGLEVCARLRAVSDVPVIVVTARADLPSRLQGLGAGADDYLIKPYDVRELVARIHAVTRRRAREQEPAAGGGTIAVGDLVVDPERREVRLGGELVSLTRKEFDLLALLAARPGVVLRRDHIAGAVWGGSPEDAARTLEVHVASLRSKLGRPGLVETVRGVGYRLVSPGAADPPDVTDPRASAGPGPA